MSPHLIRMWERRYEAVKPYRTETGHRLYSDDDIERLRLLRLATMEGQSIRQIAHLSADQLRALIPDRSVDPRPGSGQSEGALVDQQLTQCLELVRNMDAVGLEARLLRASISLGPLSFLERILHPLLELTGEMWQNKQLSISQEHLASAVVRSLLGSMYLANTSGQSEPVLICSTPQGQMHEFGALMAAIYAAAGGWRTLYLGPSLPAEEIAQAAVEHGASAIALSIVYSTESGQLPEELRKLRKLTSGQVHLLVGGRSAIAHADLLDEIGATRVGGLADFRRELARLKQETKSRSSDKG